jgi:hypothetical protein
LLYLYDELTKTLRTNLDANYTNHHESQNIKVNSCRFVKIRVSL